MSSPFTYIQDRETDRNLPATSGDQVRPCRFTMSEVFGADGVIALNLPDYEARRPQLEMAEVVCAVLDEERRSGSDQGAVLAVEAGTGIGKTLAYLVPAVLSGRKVVVSTGTLNLQDQILNREIPFIRDYIQPDLKAMCVKGRQNYLCLYKWKQFAAEKQTAMFAGDEEVEALIEWLQETGTGDRAELEWLADDSPLWHRICSNTNNCLGMHCPEGGACFINKLRRQAARSDLLIVNHHLFFSDLALRRFGNAEVLPRYESVIFDEAHNIEDIATRYFGTTFSHYQVLDLVKDIEIQARQTLDKSAEAKTVQIARAICTEIDRVAGVLPGKPGRYPLIGLLEELPDWEDVRGDFEQAAQNLANHLETLVARGDVWQGLLRRLETLIDSFQIITGDWNSGYVYWLERRERTVQLSASPIEVAGELQEFLYSQVQCAVFTSATLATDGSFKYFFESLGLGPDTRTLILPTPYDYEGRTRLYVPENSFPVPSDPLYQQQVNKRILEIITMTDGRALLLFTSIGGMRICHEFLRENCGLPLLVQGSAPRRVLLEKFSNSLDSVLLAVASFWEGIDVPGESLSCLIIDKLPFEVPSDPVVMARINKIRDEGGNPFFDFQIPRAILSLRQGIGRLMRNSRDQGLIAVMDVRLFTKGYGKKFLKSLPPSPICRDMEKAARFWQSLHAGRDRT